MSDEAIRLSSNGFTVTRMINQFSRSITNELIGRRPQYRKERWSELNEKVRQILLGSFRDHFPTLMRAYREEQRLQHAIQPKAEPRDEGVTQHENNSTSGTE